MWWFRQGLCALPAFLVVWSSCTFIVSYLIAIFRGDVDIVFPYISDTGATPPESCVFGLMTFITSFAASATIYTRYKFVQRLAELMRSVSPRLNEAALVIGILSCFGMCVVATFQETTVANAHRAGALLFFVSGVVYMILQCIISYRTSPHGSSVTLCRVRVSITIIAGLAFLLTFIFFFFVGQPSLHHDHEEKNYIFHLISAICEWITAFSFIFFFFTYIDEFKLFTIRVLTVDAE
ncbi:DNA damage-regulated autophagy modulator protein 1 [Nelusetta ayraudi]|uniref:DNA damage-regulated autophagy modulator protein 1 n=1 Tax=Nelusetta ayraudi TaxID=303726 RepID=UPI003F723E2B